MVNITGGQIEQWIAVFFYPLVRILALVASAPVLGHSGVPMRVKVGLAMVVTIIIAPTLPVPLQPLASPAGIMLIAAQILIGLAMGFALRLVIAAIELAGELIGTQMGLNFAGFFDPQTASQGTPIGAWLGLLATLLLLCANGHLIMFDALADSFRLIPIRTDAVDLSNWKKLILFGAELFRIGLYVALPVLGAMLVCNIGLGVLARVAPQLNILAIGFPVTIIVGFTMLLAALPFIIVYLDATIARALSMGVGIVR
jgi:flagellar biosynthesis protein FliR